MPGRKYLLGWSLIHTFLECQQLFRAEGLVVDLGGGLDEVLEVGSEEEVAQVNELAVLLIFDIDNTPAVLATTNLLAVDDDGLLRSNDSEGNKALMPISNSCTYEA